MIEPVKGIEPQRARCITADNPGPLTLNGTNTWVLAELDATRCIVVDPGPDDDGHIDTVIEQIDMWRLEVALVVLTHRHLDHSGGVDALLRYVSAPVRALDPLLCRGAVPLVDRERLEVDGLTVDVMATPGHTDDSLCLFVHRDGALVTGDTILGEGTSLIAWPDGRLEPYLASLQRIREHAAAGLALTFLPGHGPLVPDSLEAINTLIAHRKKRLEQLESVLNHGASTIPEIVAAVYGVPGPEMYDVVAAQVQAQLEYLSYRGFLRASAALTRN